MPSSKSPEDRISIHYFEGVNSTVQSAIALSNELSHAENARAPIIGVLEKRGGQAALGTDSDGNVFVATNDVGLSYFEDGGLLSKGLLRISSKNSSVASIYYLNQSDIWVEIDNDLAKNLSLTEFNFTTVNDDLIIVNGTDNNRMISGEIGAVTSMSDSTTPGSLFNSPKAKKSAFYKSRIYLADYFDDAGNEFKTTILKSSYEMGIIALLNGDVSPMDGQTEWSLELTSTKYFYTDAGMNEYEVYRGTNKIATMTISSFSETAIVIPTANMKFEPGYSSFNSSDEVWIAGTYTGTKQFRWEANATKAGGNFKQYDTFKLSGGDESAITLMETIGNVLVMANKNSIMTWDDYTLESIDSTIGCCSPNGYVRFKALYFLDYSGLYSTSGSAPELLSRKIERYILGATKEGLEGSAMGKKGLSIFFTIGDVTLYNNDGSVWKTIRDVCVEYNTADENLYIHTNVTATKFASYLSAEDGEKLTMNSTIAATNDVMGDELITNGSFIDNASGWNLGAGWVYNSGKVTFTS